MSEHPEPKPKLYKGQKVLTKNNFGGQVEGKIGEFYPNGMVQVEVVRTIKETFVTQERNIIPVAV